jgi:ribosomal protein L11 methyltransferase
MTPVAAPFTGVVVPPGWHIVPPGRAPQGGDAAPGRRIIMCPGPGFGTGTHETTQLCLQALTALAPRGRPGFSLLDFGSGSGILGIAAAALGATVVAVEIDPAAVAHAADNARANGVLERIRVAATLADAPGPFDLVVANILRGVLLELAAELAARRAPDGALVLSGLVATDVPEVSARYAALLGGARPEVYARGEWRALAWRAAPAPHNQ